MSRPNLLLVVGLLLLAGAVFSHLYTSGVYVFRPDEFATTGRVSTSQYQFFTWEPNVTTTNSVTQSYLNMVAGRPSCPYGGTYYPSIHTALCGWQYEVCVSFDYNCADDYNAVFVGGYTNTFVSTSVATFTEYTFYSTTTNYCVTANTPEWMTTYERLPLSEELNPILLLLTVVGLVTAVYSLLLKRRE
jgi:hypothetical protein